jgi:16S rRNA (cytosine967-C5)-methyltransferase
MQNRFQSYLLIAQKIIVLYRGEMPFAAFLKKYFSQNKKHGSTDRKHISHLCYCYYRLGKSFAQKPFSEKIKIAFFLCDQQPKEYLFLFDDDWIENWSEMLEERIAFIEQVYPDFNIQNIFISEAEIGFDNKLSFIKNHLVQPNLFLRIRPNFESIVKDKLTNNKIYFDQINTTCLALNNRTKIHEILKLNKEVVVQDYSSQQVESLMQFAKEHIKQPISVWDCCAASGGKSILARDVFGEMQLTVSDIRPSIIANLKKRFDDAGIKKYEAFTADLTKPFHPSKKYNFIICDAPCTGSGTWARTPEELYFFEEKSIKEFASLQKKIANNALNSLQKEGYFLYITCSVFAKENDEVVEYLLRNKNIQLIKKKYFEGFEIKADTMFAALFKKII